MPSIKEFAPDWISAPGDTITDILEERNLSKSQFAKDINQTIGQVNELLEGRLLLTQEVAVDLARVLGSSASFWMRREEQYRELLSPKNSETQSLVEKNWLKQIPLNDMTKFGWITPSLTTTQKVENCLNFFNVPNIAAWNERYARSHASLAFRTSKSFDLQAGAVAAWLRKGEVESELVSCSDWNKEKFEIALITIRSLTRKKDAKSFMPELERLCAECGVAVVLVRAPKGCQASGATKFLSDKKALLLLSFRYLSDDHFWFTFFHEAGHLVLHGKENIFLEGEGLCSDIQENEANAFAAQVLIPLEKQSELHELGADAKKILRFARSLGVSAGIVVGQLQHIGLLPRNYLNRLKNRYSWK